LTYSARGLISGGKKNAATLSLRGKKHGWEEDRGSQTGGRAVGSKERRGYNTQAKMGKATRERNAKRMKN